MFDYEKRAIIKNIVGNDKRERKIRKAAKAGRFICYDVVEKMVIGEAACQKIKLSRDDVYDVSYHVRREMKLA